MKIIFLDIDGVLNVYPQGRDKWGSIFHKHLIENLKHIIDNTGAKLVITSTWRNGFIIDDKYVDGLTGLIQMWNDRNLPGDIIGVTPDLMLKTGTTLQRGVEIDMWMEEYEEVKKTKIENYVIIDDDCDMEIHQLDNFVQTSGNVDHEDCVDVGYGLTKKCAIMAIEILNNV